MKVLRYLSLLVSMTLIMVLQGCGEGGTSDTAGSLTLTEAASIDNGDGTFSVTTTVSYTPPSGKSAQGVVITTTATDSFGVVITDKATLTSGSNSVKYSFLVAQHVGVTNRVSIVSSIGGMTTSVGITIPAFTPPVVPLAVSAATVDFVATDLANTSKTVTISGGTAPYTVVSSVPADISATLSSADVVDIRLVNAVVLPGDAFTATVTVTDAAAATTTITVNYFQ
ncbi:MAG: hypothetical protein IPQ16_08390 [Geobacteraceae bacterium]|nr:hypothetical protein [Geobacteraceae bacterium]